MIITADGEAVHVCSHREDLSNDSTTAVIHDSAADWVLQWILQVQSVLEYNVRSNKTIR